MKLIVGLGNPGTQYERTRHNVGFVVIDTLINNEQITTSKKMNAAVIKMTIDGKRTVLAKPTTYMNESGIPVQALLNFYKLTPNDLIVIHDDKDIPLGETRVQRDRGAAGHNGVKSIMEHIGTKDFTRIRVGVAPSPLLTKEGARGGSITQIENTADFVLGKFSKEEQKILKEVIGHIVEEIRKLVI
jgi:PTH1 family peptidyl-tRNA hydrolase